MGYEEETWKVVPGFNDYEVSSLGRIRNIQTRKIHKCPLSSWGYPHTVLVLNKKKHTKLVHRVVCETFIGSPPFPKAEVCHKDGNKTNNRVSNLTWGTREENCKDRVRLGEASRGREHYNAKLNDHLVLEIQSLREKISQRKAAAVFGISQTTISDIWFGRTWKHLLQGQR